MGVPLKERNRAEHKRYKEDVEREGKSFFPYAIWHDTLMSLLVVAVIIALACIWYFTADGEEAGILGPWYTAEADPGTIQFVPRTNQSDYIFFVNGGGNFSPVGKQGGKQEIHVVSWSNSLVICHEVMHSLGFYHEQSRSDRDTYVTIHLENVCQNCCQGGSCNHNFQKESGSSNYGPYDFDSIMHYGKCDFLSPSLFCPGNETIVVNAPYTGAWQDAIGQRNHLSRMDQVTLSFLYPQGNWRFVDGNAGGEGGSGAFLDPWTNFASGYFGTPSGGTMYVQPGSYTAPFSGSLSTPMRIEAPLGGVQLRAGLSIANGAQRP